MSRPSRLMRGLYLASAAALAAVLTGGLPLDAFARGHRALLEDLLPNGAGGAEVNAPCDENFYRAAAPRLVLPQLQVKARELCSPGYAVMHSGVTRTPLWSAEHLTPARVTDAIKLSREDSFRPDSRLPASERAELSDYARSGWDRGHMSPNKDMPDRQTQRATFLLSNMIPQAPMHNQHLWEAIEHATRGLVLRGEEAYVVTGPSFLGDVKRTGRVFIPTHVWKAVYLPQSNRAAAYWTRNENPTGQGDWELISIDELQQRTGVDAFPALQGAVRARAAHFPAPSERARRRSRID